MKIEFEKLRLTFERVKALKIEEKEKGESFCYTAYLNCPTKFEDFLAAKGTPLKEYEAQYDAMHKNQ